MQYEIKDKTIIAGLDFLKIKNKRLKSFVAILEIIIERMEQHHIFLISAGLAFNILLYLVPLLLVAIYIIHLRFSEANLANIIVETLKEVLPPTPMTFSILQSTVNEVYIILDNSSIAGLIGLITLLWISSTLFSSFRSGLNTIFRIPTPKIFVFYRLKDIVLTIVLAILIFIYSYISPIISSINDYLKSLMPPSLTFIFSWFSLTLLSLSISSILFFFLYRFVPNKRLPARIVNISTLICVISVEISRNIFAWYLRSVATFGKFYGTYAVIISIALWMYYLMLIILLSAEISQFLYEHKLASRNNKPRKYLLRRKAKK